MEISLLQYLLVWGRVRSIEKRCSFETAIWFPWFCSIFKKKNVSLTETNHYLLSCSLDRVGYLQINLAPHSQPRTKLAQRHCDSFTCRVAGHSCGMCEPSQCSAPLKKLSSPINSTVCVCWKIAMLEIALLDLTSTSRLTQIEWPPWCSKLCRLTSENGVTRWRILFYKV